MNLIQFDFDKSGNCSDTVMKNAFPPSLLPVFQRPDWTQCLLESVIFPLSSILVGLYCILKC